MTSQLFLICMVITRLLEVHNISFLNFSCLTITKCYNSRAFASISYVVIDGFWVKKQEYEPKVVPSSSKVNFCLIRPSMHGPDLLENLSSIDEKLSVIKDLLSTTQTTVG